MKAYPWILGLPILACTHGTPMIDFRDTTHSEVLTFRVPSTWKEEVEPDGNRVLWGAEAGSATLRVSLITSRGPEGRSPKAIDVLGGCERKGGSSPVVLENGNAYCEYSESLEDDGTPIRIYWFEVANHVPPNHFRLALFSLTVDEREVLKAPTTDLIVMFREQFRAAEFQPIAAPWE
jgi:hypothetical protein